MNDSLDNNVIGLTSIGRRQVSRADRMKRAADTKTGLCIRTALVLYVLYLSWHENDLRVWVNGGSRPVATSSSNFDDRREDACYAIERRTEGVTCPSVGCGENFRRVSV